MAKDKRLYMTFPNDFWMHPKIAPLSTEAKWAFVEMNGYSRMQDLDGRIPLVMVGRFWADNVVAELVQSHTERPLVLWDDGFLVIRDYAQHQQTTADREDMSKKRSESGKKGADKRWNGKPMASAMANGWQTDSKPIAETETETETESKSFSSEVAIAPNRPEIMHLFDLLNSEIAVNGGRPSTATKKNLDATRLMLDRDGRTVEQVERAIRWSQADEFWRSNILSMSKLREKFDQLRLAAARTSTGKVSNVERNVALAEQYRRGEVA